MQVEPRAAWVPPGTRPSVELTGLRDWICLLGASTENGDRFFAQFEEYVTGEHTKHFILALCEEFDEDLIVVLDEAPYFRASIVPDLTARDDLALVRLPAYSPELNPVEEYWRQLTPTFSNRLFDSLEQLHSAIDTALERITVPDMSNYF